MMLICSLEGERYGIFKRVCVCVCVCVCVREREREREGNRGRQKQRNEKFEMTIKRHTM